MGKYENGNWQIKTSNSNKVKNGFDVHRIFLEAIDYGHKIAKNRYTLNYLLEMGKFKKGLQSENGEGK